MITEKDAQLLQGVFNLMGYKNKIVLLEMQHIFVRKTPQNGFFLSWAGGGWTNTHFLGNIVKSQVSFLRAEI